MPPENKDSKPVGNCNGTFTVYRVEAKLINRSKPVSVPDFLHGKISLHYKWQEISFKTTDFVRFSDMAHGYFTAFSQAMSAAWMIVSLDPHSIIARTVPVHYKFSYEKFENIKEATMVREVNEEI